MARAEGIAKTLAVVNYDRIPMSAPVRFTQGDMKRAAAGVLAAGLPIAKIEIDPNGKIVIIPGTPKKTAEVNEWADLE